MIEVACIITDNLRYHLYCQKVKLGAEDESL